MDAAKSSLKTLWLETIKILILVNRWSNYTRQEADDRKKVQVPNFWCWLQCVGQVGSYIHHPGKKKTSHDINDSRQQNLGKKMIEVYDFCIPHANLPPAFPVERLSSCPPACVMWSVVLNKCRLKEIKAKSNQGYHPIYILKWQIHNV